MVTGKGRKKGKASRRYLYSPPDWSTPVVENQLFPAALAHMTQGLHSLYVATLQNQQTKMCNSAF